MMIRSRQDNPLPPQAVEPEQARMEFELRMRREWRLEGRPPGEHQPFQATVGFEIDWGRYASSRLEDFEHGR